MLYSLKTINPKTNLSLKNFLYTKYTEIIGKLYIKKVFIFEKGTDQTLLFNLNVLISSSIY